jgi:hypothetical protein
MPIVGNISPLIANTIINRISLLRKLNCKPVIVFPGLKNKLSQGVRSVEFWKQKETSIPISDLPMDWHAVFKLCQSAGAECYYAPY